VDVDIDILYVERNRVVMVSEYQLYKLYRYENL
jgi:hypothetical protein